MKRSKKISLERLRSYSSIFSRSVFFDILEFGDFSRINWLLGSEKYTDCFKTYLDYLTYLYSLLKEEYRCEYFFKNEIISRYIIKKLGTHKSIVFNEFRVGDSIADLAMMNGESKAFEIKTDFDSPKRLLKQLDDYHRIFNKVYLVTSSEQLNQYIDIVPDYIGVLVLERHRNKILIETYREAEYCLELDSDTLIRCLRISEYKNIVQKFYKTLPSDKGDLFVACLKAFKEIPKEILNDLFLEEIKKRPTMTQMLSDIPIEFRQMCLSLNLSLKKTETLLNNLNKPINLDPICISHI